MHPADPLAALLRPQDVRPIVVSLKCTLLTLLLPRLPLACMSYRRFTETHPADPLAALLRPQDVRPIVLSLKFTLLTLLPPRSTLRMYVLSSFH